MKQHFIMTAFGKDRPGIAADVTEVLYENGCNLENTSMTLLAGEFTLILLFTTALEGSQETLTKACRRLEQEKSISAFLRPLEKRETQPEHGFFTQSLHVEGLDQAGIVYKVSRFLAKTQVNIVNLKSTVKPSPESGTTMYVMDILVQIPNGTDMAPLEKGLTDVADELNVDITVSDG